MNERIVRILDKIIRDAMKELNWISRVVTALVLAGVFLMIAAGYTTVPKVVANVTQAVVDMNAIFQNFLDDRISIHNNWWVLGFFGVCALIVVAAVAAVAIHNRRQSAGWFNQQPDGAIDLPSAQQPGSQVSKEQDSQQ